MERETPSGELSNGAQQGTQASTLHTGVTVICVSPGIVFPAHISLGMRVFPHMYD